VIHALSTYLNSTAVLFDRMLHVKMIYLAVSFSAENKVCILEDHCNEQSQKKLVLTSNAKTV